MPKVIISVPGKQPQPYRFPLDHANIRIGRSDTSEIRVEDPSVSSLHCSLERVAGGYILRDLGSTNGIKSNHVRMAVIDLMSDMTVKFGDVELHFSLDETENAILGNEPRQFCGSLGTPTKAMELKLDDIKQEQAEASPVQARNEHLYDIEQNAIPAATPVASEVERAKFNSANSAPYSLPKYRPPSMLKQILSPSFLIWLGLIFVVGALLGVLLKNFLLHGKPF